MISPIISIPLIAYKMDDWYMLISIGFWYGGVLLALFKNKVILPLLTLFMIGYWIKEGFHVLEYATFFYFSALLGYLLYLIADEYDEQSKVY